MPITTTKTKKPMDIQQLTVEIAPDDQDAEVVKQIKRNKSANNLYAFYAHNVLPTMRSATLSSISPPVSPKEVTPDSESPVTEDKRIFSKA